MKKITLLLLMLISGTVFGQVNDKAIASAEIIEPLTIAQIRDLNFGTIAPKTISTTVTIAATATATRQSSDATLVSGGTASSSAQFDVTASSNTAYTYNVSLTSLNTDKLVDIANSSNNMDITYTLSETSSSGDKSIYVGGILTVGANQTAGTYEDTVTVTVQYN